MDNQISSAAQPKTRAEYRAEIRAILDEIRQLFREMDENHAKMERRRAEFDAVGARTNANLRALQAQLESLRQSVPLDA
jgi:hypothetical protein